MEDYAIYKKYTAVLSEYTQNVLKFLAETIAEASIKTIFLLKANRRMKQNIITRKGA